MIKKLSQKLFALFVNLFRIYLLQLLIVISRKTASSIHIHNYFQPLKIQHIKNTSKINLIKTATAILVNLSQKIYLHNSIKKVIHSQIKVNNLSLHPLLKINILSKTTIAKATSKTTQRKFLIALYIKNLSLPTRQL